MRILQVNKFLYRRAGAEAYMLSLAELLKEKGQEVELWSESKINFDRREGIWRDLKKFGHMVWSREAARKFEEVLKKFKPEVVHLHNIYHHISPAILPVARRRRVPVVMTVHDWHLINPNYSLYDHGEICERNGWRAIVHRCIKNLFSASFADVLEWRLHKWMGVYEKNIARFLVPNEFVKRKLVEGGIDSRKIEVVPLMVGVRAAGYPDSLRAADPLALASRRSATVVTLLRGYSRSSAVLAHRTPNHPPYVLFSGRLVEEKGIYVLLKMAKQLPEIKFKIAGTDPKEAEIKNQISKIKNIELLGFVEKERLQEVIAGARLVIVPSLWYELSPLSVLEAMAAGKVVVASKIGGIPELIEEGKTGFLVEAGKVESWVDAIKKNYYDEKLLKRVGKSAAEYIKRVHSAEEHYEKIMEIYGRVINY